MSIPSIGPSTVFARPMPFPTMPYHYTSQNNDVKDLMAQFLQKQADEKAAFQAYVFPPTDALREQLLRSVPEHVQKLLMDVQPILQEQGVALISRHWSRLLTDHVLETLRQKVKGLYFKPQRSGNDLVCIWFGLHENDLPDEH